MSSQGYCLCRNIKFEVTGEPNVQALCSCTHCQKTSGSAFSVNLVYPTDKVKITSSAQPKIYQDKGESGRTLQRGFCPECGSSLFSIGEDGSYYVKGGSIDFAHSKVPDASIFTRNRPSWCNGIQGGKEMSGNM